MIEGFLQKLLGKMGWLNVNTGRLQAEFASHLGWSFAVPLFGFYSLGSRWYPHTIAAWAAYSVYKETIGDGHVRRLERHKESPIEFKDFYTDLLARLLPLLILLLFFLVKK